MTKKILIASLLCLPMLAGAKPNKKQPAQPEITKEQVLAVADRVFEYEQRVIADKPRWKLWTWNYGPYYSGTLELFKVNPQVRYLEAMTDMGRAYDWKIQPRQWDANVYCISQMYLGLYEILKDPKMIDNTAYGLDSWFARGNRPAPDVTFEGNKWWWYWWSWCDALFMAPPAFVTYSKISGDMKYIDKMHELWMITHEHLYDKGEHLYYRDDRYKAPRSANGGKIFWSRGNGWVIGALPLMLRDMPADYKHRPFYENLFKEMAYKIKSVLKHDGYWSSNLGDQDDFPGMETSGSSFFCYALAWGVNEGLLPADEFRPVVLKVWKTMAGQVSPEGMLQYCQAVGDRPGEVPQSSTAPYGSGAFLLACSEVQKMVP